MDGHGHSAAGVLQLSCPTKYARGKRPSWSHHRRHPRPTLNLRDQQRAWRIFWEKNQNGIQGSFSIMMKTKACTEHLPHPVLSTRRNWFNPLNSPVKPAP